MPAPRRALARSLAAALAVVAFGAVAVPASADVPGLSFDLTGSCLYLLRGDTQPVELTATNDTGAAVAGVSVVAASLPTGVTATAVSPAVATVAAHSSRAFRTMLTIAPGAPLGPAVVAFDLTAGGQTTHGSWALRVTGPPDVPTGVTATAGDTTANVSWSPAATNNRNGSSVARWTVTASPGGATTQVVNATSATVGGLANGTAYTFTVAAYGDFGTTTSAPSEPVTPAGPPLAVTGVAAVGGGTSRVVSWDEAVANGFPVTGYTVTTYPGGATTQAAASARDAQVTGLDPGTAYSFTVRAANALGAGPESRSTAEPAAPVFGGSLVVEPRAGGALVSLADAGAAVTGYDVVREPGGTVTHVSRDAGAGQPWNESFLVSSLTNGTTYAFTVRPVDATGQGPASEPASVTPYGTPFTPSVTAIGWGESAYLCYLGVFGNGSPVTSYVATSSQGWTWPFEPGARSGWATGLANGTQERFTLHAVNAKGTGPESNATLWTSVDGPPPKVDSVTAVASGTADGALVSWDSVTTTGRPVTGYTVTASPGGATVDAAAGETSALVGGLTLGTAYTFTVAAVNDYGPGPSSDPSGSVTRVLDTTAPVVTITSAPPAVTGWDAVMVEFSGSDPGRPDAILTYTCALDGGAADPCQAVTGYEDTGDGPHSVTVTVTDESGNTGTDSASWVVDTTDPAVSITSSPAARVKSRTATVGFAATDREGAVLSFTCLLDDADEAVPCASPVTYEGLADGPHTVEVAAYDDAGNAGGTTASWTVDNGAPEVSVTSAPPAATKSHAGTVAFDGSDPDDPDTPLAFTCARDGAAATPCASPVTYTGLADGTHSVVVTGTDAAGNASTATATWLVDATAPVVTVARPAAFTLASTTGVSYGATDGGSGVLTYDVRYRGAPWNAAFGPWQYPPSWQGTTATSRSLGATAGATYCFAVRARDVLGTTSAWSLERCTARPLDDRSLAAGAGWGRGTSASYYGGTYTGTSTKGAVLTRTGVRARRLALVATRCASCATVGVYLDGVLVKQVALASATTSYRQVVTVDLGAVRTGTVTLRTLTAGRAYVDGLGVSAV